MNNLNLYIARRWLHDNQILCYSVFSLNKTTMLEWAQDILQTLADWPRDSNPHLLFDLSNPNVSTSYYVLTGRDLFNFTPTPPAVEVLESIIAKQPELRIRLGVVLSKTMAGVMTGNQGTGVLRERVTGKVFFDRDTALQWLQSAADYERDSHTSTVNIEEAMRGVGVKSLGGEAFRGGVNELRLLVNGSLEIVPISEKRPVILGRGSSADLDLSTHGKPAVTVSRKHVQVSLSNGEMTIMDLGSTNGTFIGDTRLEPGKPVSVHRDDNIKIGALTVRVLF